MGKFIEIVMVVYFIVSWGLIWFGVGYFLRRKSKDEIIREFLLGLQNQMRLQTKVIENPKEEERKEEIEVGESEDEKESEEEIVEGKGRGFRLSDLLK